MTRVFVVASTPMLRAGLCTMLATADIQVVGDAANLQEQTGRTLENVDVMILADEKLVEEARQIVGNERGPGIVLLSEREEMIARLKTLTVRGWGIISPAAPMPELQASVGAVAQGLIVIPANFITALTEHRSSVVETAGETPLDETLTAREREVLELISRGLSNKSIARTLQISEHTVKFHVSAIYAKLGASSRTDAVNRGARHGLIAL